MVLTKESLRFLDPIDYLPDALGVLTQRHQEERGMRAGVDLEGKDDVETAIAGIEALDAWTREVGAHRSLTELGVKADQVDEIAASIVCLPSGFRQLTTDDAAAILRESM